MNWVALITFNGVLSGSLMGLMSISGSDAVGKHVRTCDFLFVHTLEVLCQHIAMSSVPCVFRLLFYIATNFIWYTSYIAL